MRQKKVIESVPVKENLNEVSNESDLEKSMTNLTILKETNVAPKNSELDTKEEKVTENKPLVLKLNHLKENLKRLICRQ